MDWDAIGAIGEIVGAAAVFGSLFYVGRQISQSVLAIKGQTFQSLVQSLVQLNSSMMDSPGLAEMVGKTIKGEELSESEFLNYQIVMFPVFRNAESAHYQYQLGLIEREQLMSLTGQFYTTLTTRENRRVWDQMKAQRPREFREFIEGIIQELDGHKV
jgi:hypothetical protein